MSLFTTISRVDYVGNNSAYEFNFSFPIFSDSDLKVLIVDTSDPPTQTELVLGTDYEVGGRGDPEGGYIRLLNQGQSWLTASGKLKNGFQFSARRVRPLTQETDIRNQGAFYPEVYEETFDHLVMLIQQHQDELDRSLKLPDSTSPLNFNNTLPAGMVGRPSRAIITNETGDGFDLGPTSDQIANAQTAATQAVTSASSAATSATQAGNSASSASQNKDLAASSAANAQTSASQASTYASQALASKNTATAAASSASSSSSSAATSASSATTSKNAAAASATAANDSKNAAALSASFAETQYSSALLQATAAQASATSAANSAAKFANMVIDTFSGNGTQTAFTLSIDPITKANTFVTISGIVQAKANYSISGQVITFTTAPPSGTDNIEIVSGPTAPVSYPGMLRSGAGVPSNTVGIEGDYYLNTSTQDIYRKVAGVYVIAGNFSGLMGPQGPQGLPGPAGTPGTILRSSSTVPDNAVGRDGDFHFNTTTGDVSLRTAGTYTVVSNLKGPAGASGTVSGQSGGGTGTASVIHNGLFAPDAALGNAGDYYIDTDSYDLYFKSSFDGWGVIGNIKGSPGVVGSILRSGSGNPSNAIGTDGDYYFNTVSGDVFSKAAGAYSAVANIKGPAGQTGPAGVGSVGPAGPAGTPGSVWRSGAGAPSNALGVDNDYYLNSSTGDVYRRTSGTYAVVANILGPQGPAGTGGTGGTGTAAVWRVGTGAPSNALGADGDLYLNTTNGDVYQKASGTYSLSANIKGPAGSSGTSGTSGATWRSGAGAPSNTLGADGDYYLNTTNGDAYLRTAGTYSVIANLKGPSGNTGSAGSAGTPGSVWRTGVGVPSNATGIDGDYYLNSSTSDVYLRTSGSYSLVANIRGSTGSTGSIGPVGPQGSVWRTGSGVPASGLGVDGDYYLNTANSDVYYKASGAYTLTMNIKGATGPAGSTVASGVSVSTITNLTATNVQAAFAEQQGDIDTLYASLASKITSPSTTGQAGKFLAFDGTNYIFLTPGLTLNRVATGASDYTYNPANPAPNIIEVSDLTASRNVNLPGTDEVPDGWSLDVNDATASAGTNTINIQPKNTGIEDIAGGSAIQLKSAGAGVSMYLNRPAKSWKIRSSFGSYAFVPVAMIPTSSGTTTLKCRLDGYPANAENFDFVGSQVAVWKDLSGNNNNFLAPYSQAGWDYNLSPAYDATAFAGRGGLKFISGGNQFLESDKAFSFLDNNNYTAVIVLRRLNNYSNIIVNDKTRAKYVMSSNGYNRMGLATSIYSPYGLPKNRDVVYGICNNNGTMKYYMNGINCGGNLLGTPYTGAMGLLQLAGAFGPPGSGNPGVSNDMWITGLLLYDGPLTDNQHKSIFAFYENRYAIPSIVPNVNILVEGDSIIQGAYGFLEHMFDNAMIALGYNSFDYANWAIGGSKMPDINARAIANIDNHYDYTKPSNKNILALAAGTNDLAYNPNATGESLYSTVKGYCQSRKALKGWKIALATILPRTETDAITNNHESKRLTYNQLVRTNAVSEGWADVIVDIGSDSEMGPNAAAADNTAYYHDKIHPNDGGHARLASYWQTGMNILLSM